ncbi:hypothetical protein Tco_1159731 [Tanacetum coccineum]
MVKHLLAEWLYMKSAQDKEEKYHRSIYITKAGSNSTNVAKKDADKERTDNDTGTEVLKVDEEQGEEISNTVTLEENTNKLDEGQAGSDPGKTPESRPPPEQELLEKNQAGPNPGLRHVALTGPNPEPVHEDFIATVYPKVHESLKLPTDENVLIENPLSSSGTLSSLKNLDDAYTFGDQFLKDNSTEDESGKANVDTKVEFMVTVPIHQADSSVPLLSTPIIDLSPPKPVSSPVQ